MLTALTLWFAVASVIDLHVCPHSHFDVGFETTPDLMFGRNASRLGGPHNHPKSVGLVLDSVVEALREDLARTYNMAEIFYLDLLWQSKNATDRAYFTSLVKQGRFNFMNGGWCQNDEANVHIDGIIDQHTLGHLFLRKLFGNSYTPSVGWQVSERFSRY